MKIEQEDNYKRKNKSNVEVEKSNLYSSKEQIKYRSHNQNFKNSMQQKSPLKAELKLVYL